MRVLRIAFDCNAIDSIVKSATTEPSNDNSASQKIFVAIKRGLITPFVGDMLINFDDLPPTQRLQVYKENFANPAQLIETGTGGMVRLEAGETKRPPLHPKMRDRLLAASLLGFKRLPGVRIAGVRAFDSELNILPSVLDGPLIANFSNYQDRFSYALELIEDRGVGHRRLVSFVILSAPKGIVGHWSELVQHLGEEHAARFSTAVRETSDGDLIAAAFAGECHLVCSNDLGKNAGGDSVYAEKHRGWIGERLNLRILSTAKLARELRFDS